MKYEFDLFESIITGFLSPFSEPVTDPLKYNKSIEQRYNSCFNLIVATFKKVKSKLVLLDTKTISSLHPLTDELITTQLNLFQDTEVRNISDSIIKQLHLKRENIVSIAYSNKPAKNIVYIKEIRKCKEIPANEAKYYYYNSILKDEVTRIKKAITDTTFLYKNSEEIEHYIHKQQQATLNLSYQLIKLLEPKNQGDIYRPTVTFTDTDILNLTYIRLEELLCFIEKNYFQFIDENSDVPYRSELVKAYDIQDKLEKVKSSLLRSNVSEALLKIIYVPFLKLSGITIEERISYKELIYFNLYLNAYYDEIQNNFGNITEEQIIEILHQVNFNSIELFSLKIEKIKLSAEQFENDSERIDYLYRTLKITNQRQCKLNIAYVPDLCSLKQQITGWLEEEINYLSKKILLSSNQKQPNLFTPTEKTKIQTGLSVAQLAYFHKLQAEVGIITHKNQRDIFRHIAESYQTSKVHEISPDSVGSKYYNIDSKTHEVMKDLVIQMLNSVKLNS